MDPLAFRALHHLLAFSGSGWRGNSSDFYLVSPRVLAAQRLRPSAQALQFSNRDASVPHSGACAPRIFRSGMLLGRQLLTGFFSRMAFSAAKRREPAMGGSVLARRRLERRVSARMGIVVQFDVRRTKSYGYRMP